MVVCKLENVCKRTSREYCQRAFTCNCSRPQYDSKVRTHWEKMMKRCGRLGLWGYLRKDDEYETVYADTDSAFVVKKRKKNGEMKEE